MMTKKKQEETQEATETAKEKIEQKDPKELKVEELTDTCKRLQADFENYKKRVENDRTEAIEFGVHKVINAVLPVLDSLEQATQNCKDVKEKDGIAILNAQLIKALEPFGLRVIEIKNDKFDANKHDAVMAIEDEKDKDSIVQEVQKGYMLKNKVFRHSKVIVSKGKNEDNKADK
jgi:molecular chaperone GrpE